MALIERREFIRTSHAAARSFGPDRRFTAADVRDLHRRWLGEIYEWAGEYREVNISKGGFLFAAASLIPRLMEEFEKNCLGRHSPLRIGRRGDIVLALAETHTELLLIHPFRDGNGRIARLLAVLMALQAGIQMPDFSVVLKHRKAEYFAAVRSGMSRNYEPMRNLFASIIGEPAV